MKHEEESRDKEDGWPSILGWLKQPSCLRRIWARKISFFVPFQRVAELNRRLLPANGPFQVLAVADIRYSLVKSQGDRLKYAVCAQ